MIQLDFPILFQFCTCRNAPDGPINRPSHAAKFDSDGLLPVGDADTNVAPNLEE